MASLFAATDLEESAELVEHNLAKREKARKNKRLRRKRLGRKALVKKARKLGIKIPESVDYRIREKRRLRECDVVGLKAEIKRKEPAKKHRAKRKKDVAKKRFTN